VSATRWATRGNYEAYLRWRDGKGDTAMFREMLTVDMEINYYGNSFHHPHLHGTTVQDWPLNIFDRAEAEAQLPVLRAIAAADLHNLVFHSDFRIITAITRQAPARKARLPEGVIGAATAWPRGQPVPATGQRSTAVSDT
jgi:hypothetical protein